MTAAENHGLRVFNHLLNNGATTKGSLAHTLGLSYAQVEAGLRHIREVLADDQAQPIVYDPSTWTYDLAATERQAVRYLRYRLSILHRWMLNLETGTAAPATAKFANPALSLLQHQMNQIESSISFALTSLPA